MSRTSRHKLLMRRVCLGLQVNCMLIKKMWITKNTVHPLDNEIAQDMIYVRNVSPSALGFGKHADLTFQALVLNYPGYVSWVETVKTPTRSMLELQQYIQTFNRLKTNGYVFVG